MKKYLLILIMNKLIMLVVILIGFLHSCKTDQLHELNGSWRQIDFTYKAKNKSDSQDPDKLKNNGCGLSLDQIKFEKDNLINHPNLYIFNSDTLFEMEKIDIDERYGPRKLIIGKYKTEVKKNSITNNYDKIIYYGAAKNGILTEPDTNETNPKSYVINGDILIISINFDKCFTFNYHYKRIN